MPAITAPPERSIEQRMSALENANRIRSRRAQLKRDIKARRVDLAEVVADPPEWMDTARIWDFLLAVPAYGRVKVDRAFRRRHIAPRKTFGGMTERQRAELVALLQGREQQA